MSRSRRITSEEERALFYEVLRQAKPLHKKHGAAPAPVPRAPLPIPPRGSRPVAAPAPKPPVYAPHQPPDIGGHREAHLRRGRLEPEARIDLHGLTQDEAYRALGRFFSRARGLDQRIVLVITGKGGILKLMMPRWLAEAELAPLVSGVSPAHIKHGGGGAFYVALRRKRA